MANVFVVQIDVDEVAQTVLVVVEMLMQFRMCRSQTLKRFPCRFSFNFNLRTSTCILSERSRDDDCNRHDF